MACGFRQPWDFGEYLSGAGFPGAREGHHDSPVLAAGDGIPHPSGELVDFLDQAFQGTRNGTDQLARRRGFGVAAHADGCRAQVTEQLGGGTAAGVAVLSEEGGESLFAQVRSANWRGVVLHESQGNGRVDFRKDVYCTYPEAFEQAQQLIGQRHPMADEERAGADKGTQRLELVRSGLERSKAIAISAQQVCEQVGVANVALSSSRSVARASSLHSIGVDGHHHLAGLHECVDEQATRPLNSD